MRNRLRFLAIGMVLILAGAGCLGGGTPESADGNPSSGGTSGCGHPYMPLREGSSITYSGASATWTQSVTSNTGNAATLEYVFEGSDIQLKNDIRCENGQLFSEGYLDLGSVASGGQIKTQTVSATGPMLPENLDVGSQWSNHFETVVTADAPELAKAGVGNMRSVLDIKHRAIGHESVAVPAGTFDALVIESTFNVKTEIQGTTVPGSFTQKEYWVKGVGMVKSEGMGAGSAGTIQATKIVK